MDEIRNIVQAYHRAQQQGKKTVLATVVHVEGSSYRRPGARMLVEEDGKLSGVISGGCLEGDALKKALLAIEQQKNKLVTYNTMDEDDIDFGVQLGCNGIVHILFEPILPDQPHHPISLLEKVIETRNPTVLVTLFSLNRYVEEQPGTCFLYDGKHQFYRLANENLAAEVKQDAASVLQSKESFLKHYKDEALFGFVELRKPLVSLVVIGGGNDAIPLVNMACILGWQTTVVDGRPAQANTQRFPQATRVLVAKPSEVHTLLEIDDRTVFVLMTHNYNYDLTVLKTLAFTKTRYIGILGPKKKLDRMIEDLATDGLQYDNALKQKIYGPVGLAIGAETPEEIALSIIAEIQTVLTEQAGGFLREKKETIHQRTAIYENKDNS